MISPKFRLLLVSVPAVILLGMVWFLTKGAAGPGEVGAERGLVALDVAAPGISAEPSEVPSVVGPKETPEARVSVAAGTEGQEDGALPGPSGTRQARARGPELLGRVVDSEGEPVVGAQCLWTTSAGAAGSVPLGYARGFEPEAQPGVVRCESDQTGAIRVSDLRDEPQGQGRTTRPKLEPGRELLGLVRASGFVPLRVSGQKLSAFAPHQLGTLELQRAHSVRGLVLLPNGAPAIGGTVTLVQSRAQGSAVWDTKGRGFVVASTDAEGRFRCDEIRAGAFELWVESQTSPAAIYRGTAVPGKGLGEITIQLKRGAMIAGRIVGLPEGRSVAICADVEPSLAGAGGQGRPRWGRATADGSFSMSGLVPRQAVNLYAVAAGSTADRLGGDRLPEVELARAMPGRTDVILTWEGLTRAQGRVLVPGQGSAAPVPLENFSVTLAVPPADTFPFKGHGLMAQGYELLHYAGGRFSFDTEDLGSGVAASVNLRIRAAGYADYEILSAPLVLGEMNELGDIVMVPEEGFAVTVLDEATGQQLSGARIYLASLLWRRDAEGWAESRQGPGALWSHPTVAYGESGAKGLGRVPMPSGSGPWVLVVRAEGYLPSEVLQVGLGTREMEVRLDRGATLTVAVVSARGPIEGVEVRLLTSMEVSNEDNFGRRQTGDIGVTDDQGAVRFHALAKGSYRANLVQPLPSRRRSRRDPYDRKVRWVDVPTTGDVHGEIRAPEHVDFEGAVLDQGGPVADALVVLHPASRGEGRVPVPAAVSRLRSRTDALGRFRFGPVPSMEYTALVHHRSRATAEEFDLVVESSMESPTLKLTSGVVRGRVVYTGTSKPVEGVTMTLTAMGLPASKLTHGVESDDGFGGFGRSTQVIEPGIQRTDPGGAFEFQGVAHRVELQLSTTGAFTVPSQRALAPLRPDEATAELLIEVDPASRLVVEIDYSGAQAIRLADRLTKTSPRRDYPCKLTLTPLDAAGAHSAGEPIERLVGHGATFVGITPGDYRLETRILLPSSARKSEPAQIRTVTIKPQKELRISMRGD